MGPYDVYVPTATTCQFYGGPQDGHAELMPDTSHEVGFLTERNRESRIAVYVRINTTKFGFERYDGVQ